jgi:hypothetical protein
VEADVRLPTVAGWLAAAASAVGLLLTATSYFDVSGDAVLHLSMPALFLVAGVALIRRPTWAPAALAMVGASVWVLGDLAYAVTQLFDRHISARSVVWLLTVSAVVVAAALAAIAYRKAVSARALLRPTPVVAGAVGGVLVVVAIVAVEDLVWEYVPAIVVAAALFAAALALTPRRFGSAVLIGAIASSVAWLLPDVVGDGTFAESPIAMTVTTALLIGATGVAVWLARRPQPA